MSGILNSLTPQLFYGLVTSQLARNAHSFIKCSVFVVASLPTKLDTNQNLEKMSSLRASFIHLRAIAINDHFIFLKKGCNLIEKLK